MTSSTLPPGIQEVCTLEEKQLNYKIVFSLLEQETASVSVARLDEMTYDYDLENLNRFLILLRDALDLMLNKNVSHIQQYVSPQDWHNILKNDSWTLKNDNPDYCLIECDISEFVLNFLRGIGISDN